MDERLFATYKKEILSALGLIFSLLLIYSVILFVGRIGKVGVEFHLVPSDATVSLGSMTFSSGTQYIPAGAYHIKVTHAGFESNETTIIVSADKQQNIVAASLTATSDDAKKWAAAHQADYEKNEIFGAQQARTNGQFLSDKNPIINNLPYTDPYYKIAYRSDDNQTITLTIQTESPRYRYMATQKIRDFGYNPTDFKIDFLDYQNPLETRHE